VIAQWNAEKGWHDRDSQTMPSPLIVMGVNTELRRWKDRKLETISEKPLPDVEALNFAIPQSEWELGLDGKPRPPWQFTYVIYLYDLVAGTTYTFANSTFGMRICWERLYEAVCGMRALRGARVLPIVELDKRPMPTSFGMKSRPHLQIIDWREPPAPVDALPPASPAPPALAPPAASSATTEPAIPPPPQTRQGAAHAAFSASSAKPAPAQTVIPPAAAATLGAMKEVKPVPIEEYLDDHIPW
jgi:hypothetical protein